MRVEQEGDGEVPGDKPKHALLEDEKTPNIHPLLTDLSNTPSKISPIS
jgi:hypothetical protein